MLGDINPYKGQVFGVAGAKPYQVQNPTTAANSLTAPAINAGEPVAKALGAQYATPLYTATSAAKPAVATDFLAGISVSTSTETSTVDGSVQAIPITPGQRFIIKPKVPATFFGAGTSPNQTTYNALVGKRVLLDFVANTAAGTGGTFTILAADSAANGCVIEDFNVTDNPGLVAFSFRQALMYTA